ncbi:MAG: Metal dependent phosphohydrolase [candidate division TM6 bacterium GW2011_GWF2_30_66]|nr:MAG: Metal dependent phosphohydrolase [candidate division TM6 bacterium GW2011_GWF2_30_66]
MYKSSSVSSSGSKCPKKIRQEQVIKKTADYVKKRLDGDSSGHDWWHVYRVWTLSKKIGDMEEADLFIVELSALLHDIADWKFTNGDETVGPKMAREWLESLSVDESDILHICKIIKDISFKGAGVNHKMDTMEGMVVQDADRLDAIGAIGIARCFAYGGYKNNIMHDPSFKPVAHKSAQEYLESKKTSINHFYEKLILLKDRMNTKTGVEIADKRHDIMIEFLDDFLEEWDGKDL